MSEILSQEEIDKLLNAYSSGELDADEYKEEENVDVKVYDFKRPSPTCWLFPSFSKSMAAATLPTSSLEFFTDGTIANTIIAVIARFVTSKTSKIILNKLFFIIYKNLHVV